MALFVVLLHAKASADVTAASALARKKRVVDRCVMVCTGEKREEGLSYSNVVLQQRCE